jgi:hypothetical protein
VPPPRIASRKGRKIAVLTGTLAGVAFLLLLELLLAVEEQK